MTANSFNKQGVERNLKAVSDYLAANRICLSETDTLRLTLGLMRQAESLGGSAAIEELLALLKISVQNNSLEFLISGRRSRPSAHEIEKYAPYLAIIQKELTRNRVEMDADSALMFSFDIILQVSARDTRLRPITDEDIIAYTKREIENKRYCDYIFTYAKDIPYDQYLAQGGRYVGHIRIEKHYNIVIQCLSERDAGEIRSVFDGLRAKRPPVRELVAQFRQKLQAAQYKEIRPYHGILHEFLREPREFAPGEFQEAFIR